jgi:glycosyltransferase involved in cell wall biosynthesis
MEPLSVVIITHNEEKNIGRCLQSIKGIADEIIVLDSFSTDGTAAIVKELGGNLHHQVFAGYGAQKNAAAGLASHDTILYLDADEYLSQKLCQRIREEKEKGFPQDGYSMNRLNNYCGQWIRHGSWYPDKKLRLANRKKGAWNLNRVHETLDLEKGSHILHLEGDLLHNTYSNFGEHIDKNNRYSQLSAQWLYGKGKRASGFKIVFSPFWAWFTGYFLRAGFLDGFYGFVIAMNVAHLTFLKYIKLYQLQQRKKL